MAATRPRDVPATRSARWRGAAPDAPWAGYAACVWAVAYAVFVRGYQGLGGTVGLSGTFEDPAAMREASLIAGVGIFLVGLGALAFVRPWGLRLPRRVVIVPALTARRPAPSPPDRRVDPRRAAARRDDGVGDADPDGAVVLDRGRAEPVTAPVRDR